MFLSEPRSDTRSSSRSWPRPVLCSVASIPRTIIATTLCRSGLIACDVPDEISRADTVLSVVRKPFERYSSSGEINTQVDDPDAVMSRVAAEFAGQQQDRLDGLTVDCGSWWFNLRPSNTEPLLRLNLEAATRDDCDRHVAEVLALVTR